MSLSVPSSFNITSRCENRKTFMNTEVCFILFKSYIELPCSIISAKSLTDSTSTVAEWVEALPFIIWSLIAVAMRVPAQTHKKCSFSAASIKNAEKLHRSQQVNASEITVLNIVDYIVDYTGPQILNSSNKGKAFRLLMTVWAYSLLSTYHMSHVTRKPVFGSLRPGKTQTGLCSHRS